VQMYVLDSIFGRICHPFLKNEHNTYTYEQHGSLMEEESLEISIVRILLVEISGFRGQLMSKAPVCFMSRLTLAHLRGLVTET
jgi:hypothetical protein